MLNMFRGKLLTTTLLVGVAGIATPAFAQDATQVPPVAGSNSPEPGTQSDASAPLAPTSTNDIVVTGSLIKNPNVSSTAPVSVIGQNEISLRQENNAESLLRSIPGAAPSIGSQVNNGNGGAAFVNLRGLGEKRNIVLLDGNRIVPADLAGSVDLNNIPLALVERVDVLTGGASTTYGADAISGVVNFVTRSDFAGVDATIQKGITERGDGALTRADLTIGGNFADGKGNAVLSVGYQLVDAIYQGARNFSQVAIDSFDGTGVAGSGGSGTTVPGRFTYFNPTAANPAGGFGVNQTAQINPATGALAPTFARYNFNPFNLLQTPFQRYNIYAAAHYDVSDAIQFYTRGLFSKNQVSTIVAPSGIFGSSVAVPFSNPYLPAAARAQFCAGAGLTNAQCTLAAAATSPTDANYRTFNTTVFRRTPEVGPRQSDYTTTLFDYRVGMRGDISSHLSYDVSGGYGESENNQQTAGYVLLSRARQAALATSTTECLDPSNGCVPLNLFGANGSITPAQAAFLTASSTISERATLAQAHAQLNGDIGFSSPLANNPISFAIGGEYRRYTATQRSDSLAQSGDLGGFGSAPPNIFGAYSVYEGFGELQVPLIQDRPFFQDLSVEAGYRRSQYKIETTGNPTFGTDTYKVGGTWKMFPLLSIRGNYQRAVRAPNIGELFTPVQTTLTNYSSDPCAGLAPVNSANLRAVCLAQGAPAAAIGSIETPSAGQANLTSGGNPNLRPETSDSFTAGVILQPTSFLRGLTVTVDYYNIRIRDAITQPTPADLISACFGNVTAGSAASAACTGIRRDPVTGQLSGDTTTVAGLSAQLSNQGRLKTDGIDLTADYTQRFGFGKLNLAFNGNWTNRNIFQASSVSFARECVAYYSANCSAAGVPGSILPQFSWNQRTTLQVQNVDLSLLWRHTGAVNQEPDDIANGNGPAFVGVPSGLIGSTRSYDFGHIDAANYFDLALRFGALSNLDFTVTVTNLLDKEPPFVGYDVGSTFFNSGNTYPSTYDTLGRRFSVAAHLKF